MSFKIRPLEDRVVVEAIEQEERTSGGIILPEHSKDKPTKGKVIAVGTGRVLKNGHRVELSVKVRDVVLFSQYAGTDIKIDEKEYKILNESEILGVLSE